MICCEQEVHKSLLPRFTKTTALTTFVERHCCLQTHDAVLHQCFLLLLVTWLKHSNLLVTLGACLTCVQDVKPPSMWHLDFLISYLISFFLLFWPADIVVMWFWNEDLYSGTHFHALCLSETEIQSVCVTLAAMQAADLHTVAALTLVCLVCTSSSCSMHALTEAWPVSWLLHGYSNDQMEEVYHAAETHMQPHQFLHLICESNVKQHLHNLLLQIHWDAKHEGTSQC